MAENKVEKLEVEVEKDKKIDESPKEDEEDDAKSETTEKVENGDAEDNKENGKEDEDDNEKQEQEEKEDKTCSVKRKSAGGDAPDGTPAEVATPEKKQKLDESVAENEAHGEAEVAA